MTKRVNAVHYVTGNGLACCGLPRSFTLIARGFYTSHRPSITCKRCLQALQKADLEAYKAARK